MHGYVIILAERFTMRITTVDKRSQCIEIPINK